ncbi:hypothetical protein EG328_011615 [Venturia inaequalis]|uniref:DUF866-domain-containing protein n=1 Tax=Venturia inaequalis TaxID=5025 RepID=A0A8H3V2X5_VENIN|nr:hypothetical protein EG328_011615 [Venturia inaequalis]
MLALALTAELNGVTNLRPVDTEDQPFHYTFKVQCTSCREIHPNWVSVSRFEKNEQSGSRGEANFVWRCKSCKREHTANIVEAPTAYVHPSQQDPSTHSTHTTNPAKGGAHTANIIILDCRGLEFVEFKADGDWEADGYQNASEDSEEGGPTGTKFEVIDLTEGEWYDYDEKASDEVSIQNIKWEIRRA